MAFRIRIISPIKIDEADLYRRQSRYNERAGPDTQVVVSNLSEGPLTLEDRGDIAYSEYRIYHEGLSTSPADFDAVLIDCVFDPAVRALQDKLKIPVFGPLRLVVPLLAQIASKWAIISRTEKQSELMAELVETYGFGARLVSHRGLDITYTEARNAEVFESAMTRAIERAVQQEGARAILMGSTTMAITPRMRDAASDVPIVMPGMAALGILESMWHDGLIPRGAVR